MGEELTDDCEIIMDRLAMPEYKAIYRINGMSSYISPASTFLRFLP
jgi:hypothetical protein